MVCHPLDGVVCREHVQYPVFAPRSSEVVVGYFGHLYLSVHNLPQLFRHPIILVLRVSLYFVAGGEICPGASIEAKGPGPQTVSVCV